MTENINLDPARVRSAMSRAEIELAAARRNERAALQARSKAASLAEVWGFVVDGDEVREKQLDSEACSASST